MLGNGDRRAVDRRAAARLFGIGLQFFPSCGDIAARNVQFARADLDAARTLNVCAGVDIEDTDLRLVDTYPEFALEGRRTDVDDGAAVRFRRTAVARYRERISRNGDAAIEIQRFEALVLPASSNSAAESIITPP